MTVRTYTEAEVEELLRRQVRRFSWWLLGSVTVGCLLVATVAALTARAALCG